MSRSGENYIAGLRDGRSVIIDGRSVEDVTIDPAFRGAVRSFAALYDFQASADNRELMTFALPDGGRANRAWQFPTSFDEMVQRRRAIEAWSQLNFGFLGRSPDHVASSLSAMAMYPQSFCDNPKRAKAVTDYYEYARRRDLFIAYVIQNPNADKSKSVSEQHAGDLVTRVVDEDAAGITVRGAKMLGTSAVMADEILAGCVLPLKQGEEDYAISFAIPMATPGLRLLSRRSYEAAATSAFDYPLSAHFDENDAIVFFDNVKVPWDRVFVYRDVRAAAAQWHGSPVHVYQNYQSQIRLAVKMRFLAGLARRIAETNGSADQPAARSTISWVATQATIVEGLVSGMEVAGRHEGRYFMPCPRMLYAAQVYEQDIYPKVLQAIRTLCGGAVIMVPSSIADFANPTAAEVIAGTQISPITDAMGRVGTYKLAWDVVGSEFGSRHLQYEMLYSGAAYVTQANLFRTYDWEAAKHLVDRALLLGREDAGDMPSWRDIHA